MPTRFPLTLLTLGLLFAMFTSGAALVPAPSPKTPPRVAGIEVNQGQAKADILFLGRANSPFAVTAQSILFSPSGVRQSFIGGNPNPVVRYSDPQPGVANVFTTSNPVRWVIDIKRYSTARLVDVYPGIDAEYSIGTDGATKLRLIVREGADLNAVIFEVQGIGGNLGTVGAGELRFIPDSPQRFSRLSYTAPVAYTEGVSGNTPRTARFEILSPVRFGLRVTGSTAPLTIELKPQPRDGGVGFVPRSTVDAAGNTFVTAAVSDAALQVARFAGLPADACATDPAIDMDFTCSDVALYKFSPSGALVFATYLSGRTIDTPAFIALASNGDVVITGGTDSTDFPVTAGAFQGTYGGPPAKPDRTPGDYFAARLDPATGLLRASTYFGGPNTERQNTQTALASDGSLYFLPFAGYGDGMPVISGAVKASCDNPCTNGYAAHLNAGLTNLLYGTYLPGRTRAIGKLHSDGSVYFAGAAPAGFPVTSGAYKQQVSGPGDAVLGRLNPSGTALTFATYIGGETSDEIWQIAVAPDASVWVQMASFVECCENPTYRLVHLDATGTRILADRPYGAYDMTTDRDGNLIAITFGSISPTEDALLFVPCSPNDTGYARISPNGTVLFASYLPPPLRSAFDGLGSHGLPLFQIGDQKVEIVEDQPAGVYAGCIADAAQFTNIGQVTPGQIVTLFGSKMGPPEPLSFKLVNGRVPLELGGTRVLVDGQPVPILFRSDRQVNAILPFSLQSVPEIRVEWNGSLGNAMPNVQRGPLGVTLFRASVASVGDRLFDMAAALNEDGTVNSVANPAKKGSRVALFGTSAGATSPASEAGEVTPGARPLVAGAWAWISDGITDVPLVVEYSGGAPGLVAGVAQINVKLPDVLPKIGDLPPGVLPMLVLTPGSGTRDRKYIAVVP